jgi:hypothetical protein
VNGEAALDVATNFIQRWNHHKDNSYPYLVPKSPSTLQAKDNGTCNCQIVRSLCEWSGANRREYSIYRAYLYAIEKGTPD